MNQDPSIGRLAEDIRDTFENDPRQGRENIERLLETRLARHADAERLAILERLAARFQGPTAEPAEADDRKMRRIFGQFLGREVEPAEMDHPEFLERLAQSLNTIFDSLNQLVSVINMSFSGGHANGDETIRQFIGFHLDGADQTRSLEAYLGQISTAFLTSHDAFKKAVHTKVEQILHALAPDQVARERGSGLKIGPLRKAEDYDILTEKIGRIRKWFESGRFMEDLLREFEKHCEKLKQNRS